MGRDNENNPDLLVPFNTLKSPMKTMEITQKPNTSSLRHDIVHRKTYNLTLMIYEPNIIFIYPHKGLSKYYKSKRMLTIPTINLDVKTNIT